MFAVITLGIGLIMVAAMFPVAIQQTKLTSEEGVAASLAWTGMNTMTSLGQVSASLPVTGTAASRIGVVTPLTVPTSTWKAVNGNFILPSDNRYAWVPLYRRNGDPAGDPTTWDSTAQIIVIGMKVRNASTFVAADVSDAATANLYPRPVKVKITDGTAGAADTIQFLTAAPASVAQTASVPAVAEGTYVVISKDNLAGANANRKNAYVYRVGNLSDAATNTWELMPGAEFSDSGPDGDPTTLGDNLSGIGDVITNGTGADAYIIGRGLNGAAYEGPTMDISVYTGFVYAK